ncbi:MAG: EFR1 family ferrodoxin [Bacteroidales bacterium]|nr:EFR1 family ferrodoxin [Bacteroidales bacterium]
MIVCFSGTGNSRHIADLLQDSLGDEIVRFPPGLMTNPEKIRLPVNDGRIVWVFPVHSWGLPNVIVRVLKHARINSRTEVKHYMVCTCGDDIGLLDKQWRKMMRRRRWRDMGAYSVEMPNTYTFMKGFDVDTAEVRDRKLNAAPARVAAIAQAIKDESTQTDVVRGKFAWVKSRVLYPLFIRFMTRTAPFHTTEACNSCGKCARNCPITAIEIVNGHPRWNPKTCIMCTRCYHCCPQHAVAYGSATDGKGQYICQTYSLK